MSELVAEEEIPDKKQSVMTFVIALVLVTVFAVGAGWFVATNLLQPQNVAGAAAKEDQNKLKAAETKNADKGDPKKHAKDQSDGKAVTVLKPIVVELGRSKNTWIRVEMAVVADRSANLEDPLAKGRIANDIMAFLRNITIRQISGPSGYLHLKEDLLDRAKLSSEGKVDEVIITTLVVE